MRLVKLGIRFGAQEGAHGSRGGAWARCARMEFALALKKALTAHGVEPGPGVPEFGGPDCFSDPGPRRFSDVASSKADARRRKILAWRQTAAWRGWPERATRLLRVAARCTRRRIHVLLGWRVVHSENCAYLERNTFDEAAQRAARQNTNCTSLPKPTCIPGPSRRHARWVSNGLKEFCPMDIGISGELLIFCSVEGGLENIGH